MNYLEKIETICKTFMPMSEDDRYCDCVECPLSYEDDIMEGGIYCTSYMEFANIDWCVIKTVLDDMLWPVEENPTVIQSGMLLDIVGHLGVVEEAYGEKVLGYGSAFVIKGRIIKEKNIWEGKQ